MKEEFCKELKIPMNQVERRLDELLEWLKNFYDYEFLKGRPNRIQIKEIIGDYQPLPRKPPKQDELNLAKQNDYTTFTIGALTVDFQPNSKMKVARDAIDAFGRTKYNHTNAKAVASRYIKEPFEKYGESNNKKVWVYYESYTLLDEEILEDWRQILKEEHISEEEAACAWYRQEQGEDVSKEQSYYKKAKERFEEKYGGIPILVSEWRLKR